MKILENWIETELPDAGSWWHPDGAEKFIAAAEKMHDAGLSDETIKELLTDCYYAVFNEFN